MRQQDLLQLSLGVGRAGRDEAGQIRPAL